MKSDYEPPVISVQIFDAADPVISSGQSGEGKDIILPPVKI